MIVSALLHGLDWTGRARRRAVWAYVAFAAAVLGGVAWAEVWLSAGSPQAPRFVYLAAAVMLVPLISLGVRRLHDRGHAGGWLMLALVPWFGVIVWGYLLFAPTDSRADTPDTPVALHLLAGLLAVAVFLFVASRAFWAPYWIASGNMKPGLMVGDYLFVVFAQADALARGDVVVFRAAATGDAQIGRLIGLPGDSVQMRAGKILLNGLEVPQTRAPALTEIYVPQGPLRSLPRCGNAPVGAGGQCVTLRSYETLPDGRTYDVLDLLAGGFGDDTAVFTIPTGQYFMLGDNRDDSLDSRFDSSVGGLGMVAGGNVIARARRVAFSTTGARLLVVWHWRSGRFWQGVL